jgi:leucyl aminopeptidase
MQIEVVAGDLGDQECALAALFAVEGAELPDPFGSLFETADFAGKSNETRLLYPRGDATPARVLLVGLGARDGIDAERLRQAAATAVREARALGESELTLGFAEDVGLGGGQLGEAIAMGLELGAYRFLAHKSTLSDDERREIERVSVLVPNGDDDLAGGVATGQAIARGVMLARDLVNRPPELKTPPKFAEEAVALGERHPSVSVTVIDEQQLEADGFGGVLAVGKGSDSPPRFIIFEYGADDDGAPTICLVGKGLTFDTGGYNLKPEDGMLTMKNDMGGGAAVFGAMQVAAELELPVHLVGLVPSAENMISGRAYRPSDVVSTLSGKTVEILNTDAEGRVILSDGLFYAQRYEPEAIIELSTLTGAMVIALGNVASGVMATDQDLADLLIDAGQASGDRVWQFPLWAEYKEMVKGDVADLKNLAGRPAGSITAAAFLAEFVGEIPFAHIDIAGTAWSDPPTLPHQFRGGTGAGVRLVTEFLRRRVG